MLVGNTGDSQLTKIVRTKAVQKSWMMNEYEMGPLERHGVSIIIITYPCMR